jgi:hypothetical protein
MKRILLISIPALALGLIAIGCGGKGSSQAVNVTSYKQYTDETRNGMAVRYPDGWTVAASPGSKAIFYSSPRMYDAFVAYKPQGELGAKIEIAAMQGDQTGVQASIDSLKAQFTSADVVKAPEQTTINGMPATKVSYGFDLPEDETKFAAERYYIAQNGMITYLETAVMGNYGDYAKVFDTARASFRPAMPPAPAASPTDTAGGKTVAPRDSDVVEPAATDMKTYSGNGFSIGYPSNFSPTSGAGKVVFSGARNDSYFQVDVIDPKGMALDKIVEQNKSRYGGRAASPATVGGQKGYVFSYTPPGNPKVTSHAYFVMAGSKLYRITTNWYTPQAENYQAAFAKALGSFSAK